MFFLFFFYRMYFDVYFDVYFDLFFFYFIFYKFAYKLIKVKYEHRGIFAKTNNCFLFFFLKGKRQ